MTHNILFHFIFFRSILINKQTVSKLLLKFPQEFLNECTLWTTKHKGGWIQASFIDFKLLNKTLLAD